MIVSHVKSDKRTVRTCTLVCHCLRAVSLEHYVGARLAVNDIGSFDHLLSFLSADPRICSKIQRLRLSGEERKIQDREFQPLTPIDDEVVLRLMQLLPNLTDLSINNFLHESSPKSAIRLGTHAQQDTLGLFHLKQLSFGSDYGTLPQK